MTSQDPAFHGRQAPIARDLFLKSRNPEENRADWRAAQREARKLVVDAIRASDYLRNVAGAVSASGLHMAPLRQLLAPPISQDQFKLLCPQWPKGTEKSGAPVAGDAAKHVAAAFEKHRDTFLTRWLDQGREPTREEVRDILRSAATLIASQRLGTARRNRLAKIQEEELVELLLSLGWKKLPSKLIDMRADVPPKCFMHKTRFASSTQAHQEVDIACGLDRTYVLAMECKVTNDETNSVKRINDVIKKAAAWKTHWGAFVETAALLQGVIASKDVQRLLDSNVHVFWSHRLQDFANWIKGRV